MSACFGTGRLPAFEFKPFDTLKFAQIAGHQGVAAGQRLACDQGIVGTDGRSGQFEAGADFAGGAGVFAVEVDYREAQFFDAVEIGLAALAFGGAIIEFVHDDGGQDAGIGGQGLDPGPDIGLALEQGDHGVGIKQSGHGRSSRESRLSGSG